MPNQHDQQARPGGRHRLRALSGAAAQATGRTMPYSEEEVAEAVALAADLGRREAARQLGISESTLAYWQDKQRRDLRAARAAYLEAGGVVSSDEDPPDWRTQREQEANRAGLDARIVRDRATQAMLDGQWQLVRAGAAYYSALIGSAQVLTAGQRPMPQTPQERRDRERRIVATWLRRAEEAGDLDTVRLLQARLRLLEGEAS
jgi:hypothetical protein